MPKTISYLDFHLHVQSSSNFMQLEYGSSKFLGYLFPQKIFHRNRATLSMKPWTSSLPHHSPHLYLLLKVGLHMVFEVLWTLQMVSTNFTWVTLALGNFLSVLILLSLPHPWPGVEKQSPWVSWNTGPNSLAIIASPVRLSSLFQPYAYTRCSYTREKKKKKKTVYFSLQTGTSHSRKIFY